MAAILLFEDQQWQFKIPLKELKLQRIIQCFSTQFKNVPEEFLFQYIDQDEDLINIVCEDDLEALKQTNKNEAVTIFAYAAQGGFKKLGPKKVELNQKQVIKQTLKEMLPEIVQMVKEELSIKKDSNVIHRHIICDGCQLAPLKGIRYKCAICPDFDYCENCEATKEHPHAFIKFKNPDQAQQYRQNFCKKQGNGCPKARFGPKGQHPFFKHAEEMFNMFKQNIENYQKQEQVEVKQEQKQDQKQEKQEKKAQEVIKQEQKVQEEKINTDKPKEEKEQEQKSDDKQESRENNKVCEKLSPQQQFKVTQLSEFLQLKPDTLHDVVNKFERFSADEIAQIILDDKEYYKQLKSNEQ